jgi:O-antigen/teichoic acid export membrane protein
MPDDLEKSLETVAKGGGILFFGTILGILLAIINQILLGRILGVENYGLFYLAFTIVTVFLPFTTLGLYGSLPRFLPFHFGRGEKDVARSAIRFSQVLVFFISILFCVVVFFFSEKISTDIFHNGNLTMILKYFAVGIPLLSLSNILEAVIRSFKAVKFKVAVFDIGIWVVRLTFFIPFIVIGYALFGAIISYLIAMIFTIFTSMFFIRKKLFSDQLKYQTIPVAKKLLSFSWPLAFTAIISLFYLKTDVLLLGYYYNSTDVGLYMPALIIAQYVTLFAAPFAYIFLPVVSELFGKADKTTIESLFKSASKWIFMMVLPVFIYLLLFPEEVITLLYGSGYSEGYLALVILATGVSMNTFTGMTGGILVGGGYTKLNLTVEIIAAITNVSLNIILIPIFGILGAAIGTSASYFTRNIASFVFVYKTTKMHAFNKKYIGIVISGLVTFILFYLLKGFVFPFLASSFFVLLGGVLLLGFYVLLVLAFRCFDKNDIIILRIITKRLKINVKWFRSFIDFN